MKRSYTTNGWHHGTCGHNHSAIREAVMCAQEYMSEAHKKGGVSDRVVIGVNHEMTEGEGREATRIKWEIWTDAQEPDEMIAHRKARHYEIYNPEFLATPPLPCLLDNERE